jgi:hypothetical protein
MKIFLKESQGSHFEYKKAFRLSGKLAIPIGSQQKANQ